MSQFDLVRNNEYANDDFQVIKEKTTPNRRHIGQILGVGFVAALGLLFVTLLQSSTFNAVDGTQHQSLATTAEPLQISSWVSANQLADSQVGYGSLPLQSGSGSFAVVGSDGASVLDTPAGNPLTMLEPGALIGTTGRTSTNEWIMVTTLDNVAGWVPASSLVIFEVTELPIVGNSPAMADDSAENPASASTTASTSASTSESATSASADADQMMGEDDMAMNDSVQPASSTEMELASQLAALTQSAPARVTRVLAMIRSNGTELRSSPNGNTLLSLSAGSTIGATGRSADGEWLYGATNDGRTQGWVRENRVVAFQQSELPIVDASGVVRSASAGSSSTSATAAIAPRTAQRTAPANPQGHPIATVATTDGSRLNIRGGPGVQNAIVGKAERGEQFLVLGRNPSNDWLQIEVPGLGSSWISARYATINGVPAFSQSQSSGASAAVAPAPVVRAQAAPVQAAAPVQVPTQAPAAASAAGLSGKLVFQQSLGGEIYVYEFATGSLRKLTGGMDPAISPDGSKVTFSRFGGDGGIYVIDTNGGNERRIYSDTTVRSPKWSPDGQWIVFSRLTGEYQCRNLGFGLCLENNPFLADFTLDTKEERGLSRVNINGDEFRDIAALNTAYTPDWNENGIVYQAVTSIEITDDKPDADTTAVLKQTIGYQDPDWQPNGGRILIQVQQSSHWEIFSVQPSGGGIRALTKPVTTLVDALPSNVSPAWSPDGRHIVYVSNRAAREEAGAWRLWVMDADGSNKRALPINIELEYAFNKEQMVSWGR